MRLSEDLWEPVIEPIAYPTTLRKRMIDIAAEIIRQAGRVILKIPEAVRICG